MAPYLLGRYSDLSLGVFTGVLAYFLHERNPRSRPPPGHSLQELIQWSLPNKKSIESSKVDLKKDEEEWKMIQRELEGTGLGSLKVGGKS